MSSRKVIAVDIDDVLSPLRRLVYTYHDETYGTSLPFDSPHYYFDKFTGDSNEVVREKAREIRPDEEFRNVEPLPDAIKTIKRLQKDYDLYILTSRQDFYYEATHAWLGRHFKDVFKDVHIAEYIVGKSTPLLKAEYCQKIGASYLIDDNIDNCVTCAEHGIISLLFGEYPWNKTEELPTGVVRAKDWVAVGEYFDV